MRLLIFTLILATLNTPAFSKPDKQEIKVLTLNTWMIPVLRKMAKARAEAIGRELGNYDISLMQEAFTRGVRKTMATLARRSDLTNRYQKRSAFRINSGMFSFTRYEIVKTDFLRYFNCGGFQCLSAKGVLYIQVRLPNGQLLDLFNTHTQAYQKDKRVRFRQLKRAIKFVNKKNDGTVPAIFAGDFNVIGETAEYEELVQMLPEFRDVWKVSRPNDPGFTWNPAINNWAEYDHKEDQLLQRLDYIFIRDGKNTKISVKDASLAFNLEKIWYGVYVDPRHIFVSDHFGVETTLVLETL